MNTNNTKKIAKSLTKIIFILCILSGITIVLRGCATMNRTGYTAIIYLDGDYYQQIPLDNVNAPYDITISSTSGGHNTIHVEQNAISITSADCPDQICVKQGAIHNNLLPITCLPHNLVIKLEATMDEPNSSAPDAITY